MATIKAFNGLRFNTQKAGDLNTLVCPPYDIISDSQREAFIEKNENNIIRLELPKGENAYQNAGALLSKWIEDGILRQDEKSAIYVYEMVFNAGNEQKAVKGFVSHVKLVDFSEGIVLPHEETLSKAKQDRFNLMSTTCSNFSQIYSLYMDEDNSVFSLIEKASTGTPDMEVFDNENVCHRVWCVTDEEIISAVSKKFEDKKLYIADGHHRYETALNFHRHLNEIGESDENSLSGYISMMLVNMENDGLVVFPTHRIVKDLEDYNLEKVIEKSSEYFDVEQNIDVSAVEKRLNSLYNNGKKAFVLYDKNAGATLLTLKNSEIMKEILGGFSEAFQQLDVSVLHSLILERIFGIDKENMANQKNLTYTKIFDEAINAVDNGTANCSFILNPTRVEEIRDVAIANEKMPQKSTYFYPKLITGLVMNKFK